MSIPVVTQAEIDIVMQPFSPRQCRDHANLIAKSFGITYADLRGKDRTAKIARIRQFAMWKLQQHGHTHQTIGDALNRDASTVTQGIKAMAEIMAEVRA